MPLNTVFIGTPLFASLILKKLAASVYAPKLVISQPARARGRGQQVQPSEVEALAEELGIDFFSTDNINHADSISKIKSVSPDVLCVAAFGQFLSSSVLHLPTYFCINVHASLLPKYRGAAPIQWALLNGESETGITIQKMVKKMDAGDILLKKKISILAQETSITLFEKLSLLGGDALLEALKAIDEKTYQLHPQEETEATYAPKIIKAQARIDWNMRANEIANQIRALQPWPGTESTLANQVLKIYAAEPMEAKSNLPIGSLETDQSSFINVTCGEKTVLALKEVQLINRKRLAIHDFLKGYQKKFSFYKIGEQ